MSTKLRSCWNAEKTAVNGWLSSPSAFFAEIMSKKNFDSITIDLQHGLIDFRDALSMMQAMSGSKPTVLCRVPWLEPSIIMKLLDAGAMGIICPMINNAEQAKTFVGALKYAPEGFRSAGPLRASFLKDNYFEIANSEIISLAMIETSDGLENAREICSISGLDGIYIGPSDLGMSMGHGPGIDWADGPVKDAILHILEIAKSAGIKACLHCASTEYVEEMYQVGFDLCTLSSDVHIFSKALEKQLSLVKS